MSDLATVADLLKLPELETADPNRLALVLSAASKRIEKECHRVFASDTVTEVHNGEGGRRMLLDRFPVTSITTITITQADETTVEMAGSSFRFDPETGIVEFKPGATEDYGHFPIGFQNISIVYVAGYGTVPEDIQQACIQLALVLFMSVDNDPLLTSEKVGDWAGSYARGDHGKLPALVVTLIAPYRDRKLR